jgi:hypothetical protein
MTKSQVQNFRAPKKSRRDLTLELLYLALYLTSPTLPLLMASIILTVSRVFLTL